MLTVSTGSLRNAHRLPNDFNGQICSPIGIHLSCHRYVTIDAVASLLVRWTPSREIRIRDLAESVCSWTKHFILTVPLSTPALVFRRLDEAIHWINLYPLDNAVRIAITYPLDSDLSVG